ncbi:hypothetical protein BIFDEN_01821 [Bifidobacterium dentium ATCC 27678]|nr:hypothetical protein BIFDEN_01821 [Bifidobacterium dentium ATCC 27678]SEC88493.1 hypothetical protein SAMN05192536_2199 [Bifidobacterium dentium JCM 1195 = DSM 20436]
MFRHGIGFIRNRSERLIVDEAQYVPDLFPMIQVAVGKQQGAPEPQRHVVLRINGFSGARRLRAFCSGMAEPLT